MPPSAHEPYPAQPAGQTLAVVAEALYLVNLLLVPGVAFVILVIINFIKIKSAPPLAVCHLRQTVSAILWAGVILVIINIAIISMGGFDWSWTWVIVVLYFTLCHTTLVLLGALGLAKAMSGQFYRYPLVGRRCDDLQ